MDNSYTDGLPNLGVVTDDAGVISPATLEMDADKYLSQLEEFDLSEAQKLELLQTLWSIMKGFVEMGFSVEICAKLFDNFNAVSAPASVALHSKDSTSTGGTA